MFEWVGILLLVNIVKYQWSSGGIVPYHDTNLSSIPDWYIVIIIIFLEIIFIDCGKVFLLQILVSSFVLKHLRFSLLFIGYDVIFMFTMLMLCLV